nr:hypothetical protein [uncultured Prevotella sp.]
MKKKIFYVLMIACIGMTAIINTSCSNETDLVANKQQEKAGPKGVLISFGLSAEDYGTDNEVATRGISDAQTGRVIATSTSDLGNGIEVLTEVVEESAPKTRAGSQPVPKQDYHILAYKDGKKKAEWYGNSKDGRNFINYASSPEVQYLEPGTYKFYVYNHSHMELTSDGRLTTSIKIGSRNAYYIAEERTIPNQKEYKLDFVLKPMFARVRTKLKTYIDRSFGGPFYGFSSYKQGAIPYTRNINPATGKATNIPAATDGTLPYGKLDESGQGTEGENGAIKYYYTMTPDYTGNYFLEGTKLNQISFKFDNGNNMTIFGQKVNNMTLENKLKSNVTLEAGKSYTLVYTMYKKADYIFTDGHGNITVGSILANKGKRAVGLVVDKDKNIAIAIKDLAASAPWVTDNNYRAKTLYPQTAEGLAQIVSKFEGAKESHYSTFTRDNKGKTVIRDADFRFAAFFNITKFADREQIGMYMPGGGEWNSALKYLGVTNASNGFNASTPVVNSWGNDRLQEGLFYQVGGTPLNGTYWGAQEWDNNKALTVTATSAGAYFGALETGTKALVRPFIIY